MSEQGVLAEAAASHRAVDGGGSAACPLRILLLAPHPFFQPRGTPIAVRLLLETLSERGAEVEVLTYHEGEDVELPGVSITRIPEVRWARGIRPGFSLKKLACDAAMLEHAFRLLRQRRFDVVHAVEEGSFMALLARRRFGIPYVYDMDSSLPQQMVERFSWLAPASPLLDAFERRAIRGSIGVVAVCRALEERALREAPGALVGRIEDISLLDGDHEAAPPEELRETIGHAGPLVLYVGNLEHYQGIDLLLDGFRLAAPRSPGARLVVLGGADEDVRRYRERARAMGLEERAHFLGPRPVAQLGAYLRQADVLASPRITGTNTPMKIYSYLDSGTAVLATRLPTHTQVMDDETALLVEPTPAAVAEGLVRLLADGALRESLAAAARERVRAEYSREAFTRKVNRFYDAVEARLAAQRP